MQDQQLGVVTVALSISGSGNNAVPDQLVVKGTGAGLPKVPSAPHLPTIQKLNIVKEK